MKNTLTLLALTAAILTGTSIGHSATLATYTDRTAFTAAAGGSVSTETFNSFVSETPFHTSALDVGPFTISMSAGVSTSSDRNRIDLPPHAFAVFNVDGTAIANALTGAGQSLYLVFDSPITAFGADFADFNDQILRTNIVVGSDTLATSVTPASGVRFFGFTSDTPFTTVEFRGVNNDGYGIDNVAFSSNAGGRVPEGGSTLVLLGLVTIGLAGIRRFKV